MNKRYILLGAGMGIGVLATMAVFYLLRPKMEQNGSGQVQSIASHPMQAPISGMNPQVYQPVQTGSPAATGLAALPPPWVGANAKPATPTASVATLPDQAALQGIQAKLASMTAGGKPPDPRALDALLSELERTQHTSVVGGVNIAALRDNLAKATEIGNLAKEMEQAAKQPKPDVQKIQGMMDQIKQLQVGMRADLMVAPAGAKP